MNSSKNIAGFQFMKIGKFYNNEIPLEAKYQGENILHYLSLELENDDMKKLEESAYLIYSEDELKYVGEYSFNLQDRWLRKGTYVWHHMDKRITDALDNGSKNVSIWVTEDPYLKNSKGTPINISKSIESHILKEEDPEWNIRGKMKKHQEWIDKNCKKMSEIIKLDI